MRIAIVTDAWHPQISGVVTTIGRTARILSEWGHTLLMITPEGFPTVPCPSYREIPLALFPGNRVARMLDEFAPDAVHIATEGPLGWAGRRYCLDNRIGFTTSYHTRFPEYVRMRFPIPLAVSYAVMRRFHAPARRTMVVSDDLRRELQSRGFANLEIWSRGVDRSVFRPHGKDFLKDPRPITMYAGRVAVEKNIEAFLHLDLPGTKYVIGDGPARAQLMDEFPGVRFPGFKQGIELAQYMAAADVFVFPSRTDTFGVVMLEANACGVPVAAFPVTGPKQVVRNGVNGILDEDLRSAVLQALHIDLGGCLLEADKFSWEKCTTQFLKNLHFRSAPQKTGQMSGTLSALLR